MIDIGADLQRAFDEGYEKGKADRPQGEWISCSERLPEHDIPKTIQEAHTGIKYLVTLSTGTVLITKWKFYMLGRDEHGLKGSWGWGHQFRHQIRAWQPLPEPYMEGADDA